MTRYDSRSESEKLSDNFCDLFTDMANQIAEALDVDYQTIYAITDVVKLKALNLYQDQLWGREDDNARSAEKIDELNEQVGDTLRIARNASDLMPIAFTHHEDAQRYGWIDRDEQAWKIITDLYVEMMDMMPMA